MTLWLVDASVLLAREDLDDANHNPAVQLLAGPDPLATLDLAFYEVTNVAVRSWHDELAAGRLCDRITAVADDGGLIRADSQLLANATLIAAEHGISAYDAAYVAAARSAGARLVSCDVGECHAAWPASRVPPPPGRGAPDRPALGSGCSMAILDAQAKLIEKGL